MHGSNKINFRLNLSSGPQDKNLNKYQIDLEIDTQETQLKREICHLKAFSSDQDNPMDYKILYEFPHYFRYLFNASFLLLVSPFWVKAFEPKKVPGRLANDTIPSAFLIVKQTIQMILCGIFQGIGLLFCLIEFCQKINGHVTEEPQQIFIIANFILWSFYVFLYIKLSWSSKTLKLFCFPLSQPSWKTKIVGGFYASLGLLLSFFYIVLVLWFTKEGQIKALTTSSPVMDDYSTAVMDIIYRFRHSYNHSSNNQTEMTYKFIELSDGEKALVVFYIYAEFRSALLIAYLEMFNYLVILAVYEVAVKLDPVFHNTKRPTRLLSYYSDMWDKFRQINDINGPILLVVYLQIMSWVSSSALNFLDDGNYFNKVRILAYYLLYVATFVLAAETNYKAESFEQKIWMNLRELELLNEHDVDFLLEVRQKFITTFLNGTKDDKRSLPGGKFLSVSYPFVGASMTILITFVVISVQFTAGN